ncbi:MAG: Fic family protein [Candidatus Woesearchaeota archaeon]
MNFEYPTVEEIIELNLLILEKINVKKSDKFKVLSYTELEKAIESTKNHDGDLYDKATTLLKGLIKNHAFASGNRRTAFIATKNFIKMNDGRVLIKNKESNANVMQGIRENYYTHDEIKRWLKNGKIKKFKRF